MKLNQDVHVFNKHFLRLNVFLYKALTWKMKYLYSLLLAKLKYEVDFFLVREHTLSVVLAYLLYFTVIQIIPTVELDYQ